MANALAPPNRNALYGPTESYGLPRQDRYGRFLIGGDLGLNTPAGQLDAAFEIMKNIVVLLIGTIAIIGIVFWAKTK